MKNKVKWVVLGLLLMVIFIMTMMKPPEEITNMLSNVTDQLRTFSVIAHIIFLVVIVTPSLPIMIGHSPKDKLM